MEVRAPPLSRGGAFCYGECMNEVTVLYEDDDVLVVNKPAGLLVHATDAPAGASGAEPTLVDWILKHYPSIANVSDSSPLYAVRSTLPAILRPGIVHRLDRETSGAMVIAKTQAAFSYLKKLFQRREVQKKYHAFAYGTIIE